MPYFNERNQIRASIIDDEKVNRTKMVTQISPHLIHALDASILREITLNFRAKSKPGSVLSSVRDSFRVPIKELPLFQKVIVDVYNRIGDQNLIHLMLIDPISGLLSEKDLDCLEKLNREAFEASTHQFKVEVKNPLLLYRREA